LAALAKNPAVIHLLKSSTFSEKEQVAVDYIAGTILV
jgi:hypothetical protein